MTRAGRVVQVQFVLTAMLVYLAMATELPSWAIKAIDKIRRGFIWKGPKEAKGGHCLIAWPKVCRSRELGGLGISDLKSLGIALRARWPWLKKSEPNKPWASLPLQVSKEVDCLLSMAVVTELEMAPTLFSGETNGWLAKAFRTWHQRFMPWCLKERQVGAQFWKP